MNRRERRILAALVAVQGILLAWNLMGLLSLVGTREPRWVVLAGEGLACVTIWFALRYFYLPAWRYRWQRSQVTEMEAVATKKDAKLEALVAERCGELLMLLDPENKARLLREQPLKITGSDGGRYLISRGYNHNVLKCEDGGYQVRYCANVRLLAPCNWDLLTYTTMLAQVLALTTDEKAFLRVAIRGGLQW